MSSIYLLHQNLALITLAFLLWRALVASLGQWRGKSVWGYKVVAISANTLLDIQILLGIILVFFGIKPPLTHLMVVTAAAILAHFSYYVEKRQGSSFATLALAWGAVVPVMVLYFW